MNKSFETPAVLHKHGRSLRYNDRSPCYPHTVSSSNCGLGCKVRPAYDEGIKAITINAARILGLDERLGSIEPGKDADLVLWEGDPLSVDESQCSLW